MAAICDSARIEIMSVRESIGYSNFDIFKGFFPSSAAAPLLLLLSGVVVLVGVCLGF